MTHAQRIRLVSAGVVASYIHDISARTGSRAAAPAPAPSREPVVHARRDFEGEGRLAPWRGLSIRRELSPST